MNNTTRASIDKNEIKMVLSSPEFRKQWTDIPIASAWIKANDQLVDKIANNPNRSLPPPEMLHDAIECVVGQAKITQQYLRPVLPRELLDSWDKPWQDENVNSEPA